MNRTLGMLSLAALLAMGGVATAQKGGTDSGQQSPANNPATGSATTGGATGMSAQSAGTYPGGVGPSGSHEPDATNPVRSSPSGGGGQGGGNGGASGGAGGGATR
jgi:hypothetical protein